MVDGKTKRIVIVGATSAIAEHCARQWLEGGSVAELVLVGRDPGKLGRVADDLRVRGPSARVTCVQADFTAPAEVQACVDRIAAQGRIDIALIAHGSLPDQEACETNLAACHEALLVNGTSPAMFAEAMAGHMQKAGTGTLAVIGSVAGDRGRKSNYAYGAAKGLVERYVQGLQHRLAGSGVSVVLIKPGPTDTPMTAQLKQKGGKLASVDSVARQINRAIQLGQPVAYVPGKWRLIMTVIRLMPRAIFNKLDI